MSNKYDIKKDQEELNEVLSKCIDAYVNLEFEDAVRTSTIIILKFIGANLDDSKIDEIVNEMNKVKANRADELLYSLFKTIIEIWQITIEKLRIMQEQESYQYIDDTNGKLIGKKRLNS